MVCAAAISVTISTTAVFIATVLTAANSVVVVHSIAAVSVAVLATAIFLATVLATIIPTAVYFATCKGCG